MKTTLVIEIDHVKPLPKDAMSIVENRINDYLYAHGVDVDVAIKAVCGSEGSVGVVLHAGPGASLESLYLAPGAGVSTAAPVPIP